MVFIESSDEPLESIIKVEPENFQALPERELQVVVNDNFMPIVLVRRLEDRQIESHTAAIKKPWRRSRKAPPNPFEVKSRKPIRRIKHKKPYLCDYCDKICRTRPGIVSHLQCRHFRAGPFYCDLCPTLLRAKFLMTNHMRSCHLGIKPFACETCFYRSSTKAGLLRHIRLKHDKKKNCPVCGKLVSEIALHVKQVHNKPKEPKASCDICGKLMGKSILKHHILVRHKNKPNKCTACEESFSYAADLRQHFMEKHFVGEKFKCSCGVIFNRKNSIVLHQQTCLSSERVLCKICSKDYKTMHTLIRHWNRNHFEKHGRLVYGKSSLTKIPAKGRYICDFCGIQLKDRYNIMNHLRLNHHVYNPPLNCNHCSETFTSRKAFNVHKKVVHKKVVQSLKQTFNCDVCDFKTNLRPHIRRHVMTHVKSRTKCPICLKLVTVIELHIQGHKEKQCRICNNKMEARCFRSHMSQHKTAKKCKQCDKTFIASEMRKHIIAAHSEGEVFKCHCGSLFKNIEGLRRHKLSHGEKNIPCKDCNLMFNMQTALMQHVKFQHPESYKNRENKKLRKKSKSKSLCSDKKFSSKDD